MNVRNVWAKDDEKLRKQYPELKWIAFSHGKAEDGEWEISVIHTSDLHAIRSWGWPSSSKIIISDFQEDTDGDEDPENEEIFFPTKEQLIRWKKLHKQFMEIAKDTAESFNKKKRKP